MRFKSSRLHLTGLLITSLWLASIAQFSLAAPEEPQLLGKSQNGRVLSVSPNGKWLLSWDGVIENSPATTEADRLVWDLSTGKSRDLTHWSSREEVYDDECGWTPDNRIFHVHRNPQPLAEGNAPYSPTVRIENPDGSGKVVCHDKLETYNYDDEEVRGHAFSKDGKSCWLLTNKYWRHFNGRTGKLIARRVWAKKGYRPSSLDGCDLSPDGQRVLSSSRAHFDYAGTKIIYPQAPFVLYNAATSKIVRHLKTPPTLFNCYFVDNESYNVQLQQPLGDVTIHYRLSDGKELARWQWPTSPITENCYIHTDLKTGKITTFPLPRGNWPSATMTPDQHTLYALNDAREIYRFAVE